MPELKELGIVKEGEIVNFFVHREQYAYHAYDHGCEDCLKIVVAYLDCLKNFKLIVRSRSFTYIDQYRAKESGSNAADEVISEIFREPGGDSA